MTQFLEPKTIIQEKPVPENTLPAGYAALIATYKLDVPLPRIMHTIGTSSYKTEIRDDWVIHIARHAPADTLEGHLTFALKYEGLDLAVLKRLFTATDAAPIIDLVRASPTGIYARRIWFLYEWLMEGERLDLPDANTGTYTDVVDSKLQYGGTTENVRRYRVRNNLPGTQSFCPLVFRQGHIEELIAQDLKSDAQKIVADIPKDIMARAAAFLLLKDSKASYTIEGEAPAQDRIQRWGRAIGDAGKHKLSIDELLRLQKIVLGDARFVKMGFRGEGGFVGEHDRDTHAPIPDHISARNEDLDSLMGGLIEFATEKSDGLDPIMAAAVLAFGFVYIHPFEDGNGRIHRYLIHHMLAQRGFNPPGVVFPVSGAILDRIDEYRRVLESYSERLLPHIRWKPTPKGNVEILNDTGDFYRYFDATPHVAFLLSCVEQTITEDLPKEADFLRRYEQFKSRIESFLEMPDRSIDLLFNFLKQNDGKLSKRAIEKEFDGITEEEVEAVEAAYSDAFAD
jgi:Fic family protein